MRHDLSQVHTVRHDHAPGIQIISASAEHGTASILGHTLIAKFCSHHRHTVLLQHNQSILNQAMTLGCAPGRYTCADYKAAILDLDEALSREPHHIDALCTRGAAYAMDARLNLARADCDLSVGLARAAREREQDEFRNAKQAGSRPSFRQLEEATKQTVMALNNR